MSKQRRRRLAKALMAGVALAGLNKMMAPGKDLSNTARESGKLKSIREAGKIKGMDGKVYKAKSDSMKFGKTLSGDPSFSIGVDKAANPRERAEIGKKYKEVAKKASEAYKKRSEAGMIGATTPKSKNQVDAMSKDFGLGMFDGAKKGKMIRARGGGMAMKGMKPTKLY